MADETTTTPEATQGAITIPDKGVVLLDFWAEWCGPCKVMAPILEDIKKEYADKLTVIEIDVDENSDLASEYGIMSVPTYIFLNNGTHVNQVTGAQSKESFVKVIEEVLSNIKPQLA